jgi:hypothetical protein
MRHGEKRHQHSESTVNIKASLRHTTRVYETKWLLPLGVLTCKEGPRKNATLESDFMITYVQKGGREKTNSLRD